MGGIRVQIWLWSLIEMLRWDPNHADPPGNPWIQTILQRAAGPKFPNSDVKVSWQVSTNCNYSFCCQKVAQPVGRLGELFLTWVIKMNLYFLINGVAFSAACFLFFCFVASDRWNSFQAAAVISHLGEYGCRGEYCVQRTSSSNTEL